MLPIRFLSKRLLASAMLLALTAAAQAQSDTGAPATSGIPPCPYMAPHMQGQGMGPGMMERGFMGQGMGMPMAPWMVQFHGNAMMPGTGYGHAFLNGLNLSEEQQDRVFNILHKQAPRQRDSMKLLNKSMTALHELARSGNYSDANAQSIARSIGQASADLALMHAQTERQIMEILTPEQRRLIEERGFGARGRPGASGPGAMAPRR